MQKGLDFDPSALHETADPASIARFRAEKMGCGPFGSRKTLALNDERVALDPVAKLQRLGKLDGVAVGNLAGGEGGRCLAFLAPP